MSEENFKNSSYYSNFIDRTVLNNYSNEYSVNLENICPEINNQSVENSQNYITKSERNNFSSDEVNNVSRKFDNNPYFYEDNIDVFPNVQEEELDDNFFANIEFNQFKK